MQLELIDVPNNMTIVDPYVSYASIGRWGCATSVDTCVFDANRAEAIEPNEIIWRATYKVAGSDDILQQVFTNFGPLPPILPGDITGEGVVDLEDLAILAVQWLQSPGTPSADIAPEPPDNIVNFLDFAVLAGNWLAEE